MNDHHLLKHKKVAIIGAGPVGLTMAKLLQQNGADVTVYERDKNSQARIWGGTLDLHQDSGQDALKKAGLLESYFAKAIPMGRNIADEQGNVLYSKQPANDTPEINRNNLRTLLLDSLSKGTVVWNQKFIGLEEQNGKWALHFENNIDATADFVIGANGGMSVARKYVTDAEAEDTGTFIIQGEVFQPEIKCSVFYKLCSGNILMVSNKGTLLVANPNNNGALTYNVMFRTPREWENENELNFQDTENITSFLCSKLSHWNECYKQLFNATSFFVGLPTRKLPLDKLWKSNRTLPITLIGDAAHVMPPFAGKGVNIGLMDALILSDNLTNRKHETILAAISDYEQKMKIYATQTQQETSQNEMAMFHPEFSFLKLFKR